MNKKYRKREIQYGLFVLPAFIIFLIFFFLPVLQTLGYSVTDRKMIPDNTQFVGIQNFVTLFTDTPEFFIALKNNIFFTVVVTVLRLYSGAGAGSKAKGQKFLQNVFLCAGGNQLRGSKPDLGLYV